MSASKSTAAERKLEAERCAEIVRAALKGSDRIYTLTTYGRGQTDHVRLFVVGEGRILDITYYVAAAVDGAGRRIVPGKGWAFRGGGYSKALEAADWAFRVAGLTFDQSKWQEL